MRAWFARSLSRKLLVGLAGILAVTSAVFLVLFIWIYRAQLEKERGSASAQVNLLLQASLENAMLKRDIPGLKGIVSRLGGQQNIRQVMIVNTKREVRFASDPKALHRVLTLPDISGCVDCANTGANPKKLTHFIMGDAGANVLRSVNPIYNKTPCTECHGTLAENPVNGILIVDYDAGNLRRQALIAATGLAGAGGFVVFIALFAAWIFVRRAVIVPVRALNVASQSLGRGDTGVRASINSEDELGQLCRAFNAMAGKLENALFDAGTQRAFLQSLIDAIPDGIRVIDRDFKILLANTAYCEQVQVPPEQAAGTFCYVSSHGRKDPCPPSLMTCPLSEITHRQKPMKVMHRHERGNGETLAVEIYAAPLTIRDDTGERVVVVEAIRDLSKQVKITQEQRLSELGQLAAGVAHEIHNPLASVRLGLQALLKLVETADVDAELLDYLRQVDDEVDSCIEVTKRLLQLSMPPSDYTQLVSLSTIVPEVTSLLKYEAEKDHVVLESNLGEDDLRVLATDSEMRMLVLNLVQNAFHAMPDGGHLVITGRIEGNDVVVSFEDSGTGIKPDIAARIFDPFFSSRADGQIGTGLGLSICKSIVERYGGTIEHRSKQGRGANFTFTLPSAQAEAEAP